MTQTASSLVGPDGGVSGRAQDVPDCVTHHDRVSPRMVAHPVRHQFATFATGLLAALGAAGGLGALLVLAVPDRFWTLWALTGIALLVVGIALQTRRRSP